MNSTSLEREQARALRLDNAAKELNLVKDIAEFLQDLDLLNVGHTRQALYAHVLSLFGGDADEKYWTIGKRAKYLLPPTWDSTNPRNKSFLCVIGKQMSELFRERRGCNPAKAHNVNHYPLREFQEYGDNMIREAFNEVE